ncbi:MAG TPA: electron transfer flavoprotein subunit alpha/FixB family protein [Gaiellaceae bacterium]|jgi:electron transfer flavoprotein alpha subunit|nr:electron transfer flavoprotein subunit alpha/FixB family protein [Gaiellaceae bacterium]HXY81903.1 electron transfer flavoprotein subunit alpha/FixB family protein [Gaiellaceae bacterium]
MSVLVVAEHLRGQVREVTYELVSAARSLGGPTVLAVIASDPGALDVNRSGVDEIVHVRVTQDEFESDVYQRALEALVEERQPQVVLLGFTVNGMGYAAAVAAKLGLGFASDVFAVSRDGDGIVATRAFYGSKVHGEVEFPAGRPVLLLLRPTAWPPAEGPGAATVSELALAPVASRARHKEFREVEKGDVDITTADFLLSIGRGIGEQENVAMFEELAGKLGATLSVSRPLVDAGWMSNARQVGQSGKTVKPKVYLAFGISGAVQHLAGMKTSETIIAVNTDPEAAIFDVAHYGAVADLFDVAEELAKLV